MYFFKKIPKNQENYFTKSNLKKKNKNMYFFKKFQIKIKRNIL